MHAPPFAIVSKVHATIAAFGYRFTVKKETPLSFCFQSILTSSKHDKYRLHLKKESGSFLLWVHSEVSCAASKYIQCIEKTDSSFFFFFFRFSSFLRQRGAIWRRLECSHDVVNVFVPCICWVFHKKVPSPREEGKKWQICLE